MAPPATHWVTRRGGKVVHCVEVYAATGYHAMACLRAEASCSQLMRRRHDAGNLKSVGVWNVRLSAWPSCSRQQSTSIVRADRRRQWNVLERR
eukprot:3782711-Pleurochrysis_carterae.AAC.4